MLDKNQRSKLNLHKFLQFMLVCPLGLSPAVCYSRNRTFERGRLSARARKIIITQLKRNLEKRIPSSNNENPLYLTSPLISRFKHDENPWCKNHSVGKFYALSYGRKKIWGFKVKIFARSNFLIFRTRPSLTNWAITFLLHLKPVLGLLGGNT